VPIFGKTLNYIKKINVTQMSEICNDFSLKKLQNKANEIRIKTIHLALEYRDGHVASAFSFIEIMVALFEVVMKENDQFILSKGHGVFSLYTYLHEKGFNPTISGHPDIEPNEGVMCTTGSLGHGIAIGVGKAFAKKIKNEEGVIYVVVGDGEIQEGSVWESLNIIRKFKINNIAIIVDYNKLQAMDTVANILDETNLKNKFEAFGMNTVEIDGHNFNEIINTFSSFESQTSPCTIIAHTIKGKGVSFMEGDPKWQSRMLEGHEVVQALNELKQITDN